MQVTVRTTNYIIPMSVGPQLAWPSGPIRPDVNAGVGARVFLTGSAVEGTDNLTVITSSTNQSDAAMITDLAGGGVRISSMESATRLVMLRVRARIGL